MYQMIKNNNDFKKDCRDCYFCQGALSWFCVNEKVKEEEKYHTWISVYGYVKDCEHWKPCKTKQELTFTERLSSNIIYTD